MQGFKQIAARGCWMAGMPGVGFGVDDHRRAFGDTAIDLLDSTKSSLSQTAGVQPG